MMAQAIRSSKLNLSNEISDIPNIRRDRDRLTAFAGHFLNFRCGNSVWPNGRLPAPLANSLSVARQRLNSY